MRYASVYGGEWYDATCKGKAQSARLTRPHWDVPLEKQQDGTHVRVKQEPEGDAFKVIDLEPDY